MRHQMPHVKPAERAPYSNIALAGTKVDFGNEPGSLDMLFFSTPADLSAYRVERSQIEDALNAAGIDPNNAYEVHCYMHRHDSFWALGASVQSPGAIKSYVVPANYNDGNDKVLAEFTRTLVAIFNEFLALLNCKNVIESPVHPSKAKQRKRKRKGLRPLVSYKVLKVVKGKTVSRRIDHSGGGNDKRLHSCRGHYKEYTADKPLFGHTVGRVWCPAHVRGNKELGAVVKSYEVSRNQAETN
jgi:hypothetical protein